MENAALQNTPLACGTPIFITYKEPNEGGNGGQMRELKVMYIVRDKQKEANSSYLIPDNNIEYYDPQRSGFQATDFSQKSTQTSELRTSSVEQDSNLVYQQNGAARLGFNEFGSSSAHPTLIGDPEIQTQILSSSHTSASSEQLDDDILLLSDQEFHFDISPEDMAIVGQPEWQEKSMRISENSPQAANDTMHNFSIPSIYAIYQSQELEINQTFTNDCQ
ncbi:MAG: hypothetical protein EZS28_034719 [Streblomastix strix]|uniref:Uncharacterized protein n=1 Tax=Streblomastix strix TaxID=222440 RepID=A0A5J4UJH5_9EUKA|nr:MAG: hypothetical protein EZS28_034719 [Streblomastix strix]